MSIKIIKIKQDFKDERGFISVVLDKKNLNIKSILLINRKQGAITANHYHKKDTHYILCLEGSVKYSEKNLNKKYSRIESVIMGPGDMILSNQLVWHSTEFLKDSVILAFATEHRNQKNYENDTIRISPDEIKSYVKTRQN